jgi:hypothetical protein
MQGHYAIHPPIGLCHPFITRSGFYAAIQTYFYMGFQGRISPISFWLTPNSCGASEAVLECRSTPFCAINVRVFATIRLLWRCFFNDPPTFRYSLFRGDRAVFRAVADQRLSR